MKKERAIIKVDSSKVVAAMSKAGASIDKFIASVEKINKNLPTAEKAALGLSEMLCKSQTSPLHNQVGKTLNTSIRYDKGCSIIYFRKNKRPLVKLGLCTHRNMIERFSRFIGAG